MLDRHGLVERRGRTRHRAQGTALSLGQTPNELWCTDYKGEFLLGNRQYCYPLTVTDHASRYLLTCEALSSTKEIYAFAVFETLFKERGMPSNIRSDNEPVQITRHGKSLHRQVTERRSARARIDFEEPPLPPRTTVWLTGSYNGLRASQRALITKLLPIIAKGFVDIGIRVVSGESDMLIDFARHYRDAAVVTKTRVPNAIALFGRLRQRDARNLFRDAIGTVPTVAVVIGGGIARGRVMEEYDTACRAKIPVFPVPATGGAASLLKPTARRADDLLPLLAPTAKAVDIGDIGTALIKTVQRYID